MTTYQALTLAINLAGLVLAIVAFNKKDRP
ncbi:putative holin-like toxin [Alicyclobacillus pomorum]|nr:putative holin-like toxin [Alicyclobacillus pomorum]